MDCARTHCATALLFPLIAAAAAQLLCSRASATDLSPELRSNCVSILRQGMHEGVRWVKIHAGEDLAQLDYLEGVEPFFKQELGQYGNDPEYRVGIWRVLAQAVAGENRAEWTNRIRGAFLDQNGPDRSHAAETLGKLGYRLLGAEKDEFARVAQSTNRELAVLARWVLADSSEQSDQLKLTEMLLDPDPRPRGLAAYALRFLPKLSPETFQKLTTALKHEPTNSQARIFLVCSAFVQSSDEARAHHKPELLGFTGSKNEKERYEACWGLAKAGTAEDLPRLEKLLRDPDLDVRVSAANAILRIARRGER